ncbi:MAG TPA: GNAT family N-acetyltransferase [Solirubrobacteraceae bacterium]|nr:GNAT family N-acetyltransferase [Solirubrobacteraceae bacterium]
MTHSAQSIVTPRSLVRATELDVLPLGRVLVRRDGYLAVRSPGNPGHYWGNYLLFDDPPQPGDAERWEALFAQEFADDPRIGHRTFAWDRGDGALGAAREEFTSRGYEVEILVGLVAPAGAVAAHPRASTAVTVRALDPARGADMDVWEQVVELQVAGEDRFPEDVHRAFCVDRMEELREMFRAGRGAWYVALDAHREEVLGSCGVVVTAERGRFQAVDTAEAHRRKGICSRLVVEAAHRAASDHRARQLVICADPHYHALGLYESLGFAPAERAAGVCRQPPENRP